MFFNITSKWEDPENEKSGEISNSNGEKSNMTTTLMPRSPYYLASSKNLGMPFVVITLNGDNYQT